MEKWASGLDLTPAFVRENQELFVADGARSDEEEAVLQNLRQPARIEFRGAYAPRVSCSAPSPNAFSSVPLETFFEKSEMKLQTATATIHDSRITIHATTSASLTTFNILFKTGATCSEPA